jgi:hypothetical protein
VPFNILNVHIDYENSKLLGVETFIEEFLHTFFIEELSLFQRVSIPPSMYVNPLA